MLLVENSFLKKHMKQIFEGKYNQSDALAIVSLYPKKGETYSTGISGIASFAKNTASNLSRKTIVFAQYERHLNETYEEDNVFVNRCFKKQSPFMWIQIIKRLFKFKQVKNILIQFDFALYGGIFTTSLIIPFLAFLMFSGYKVTIVSHSVVTDVSGLAGHLGIKDNLLGRIKGFMLNKAFRLFYFFIGLFSHTIIVTENALKEKLSRYISPQKLIAIPHGVDTTLKPINKERARKLLGIKKGYQVVLLFGFINWFKGSDFFVDVFKNTSVIAGKKTVFLLAGGPSATLKKQKYYQDFLFDLKNKVGSSKNIKITGFIPQEKISQYFSSADLVVFPYRYFMCASGVLSLVFSYKKPFILSKNLAQMFSSQELQEILGKESLKSKDIIFNLNPVLFRKTTKTVLQDGAKEKLANISSSFRTQRSWQKTALLFERVIFSTSFSPSRLQILRLKKI